MYNPAAMVGAQPYKAPGSKSRKSRIKNIKLSIQPTARGRSFKSVGQATGAVAKGPKISRQIAKNFAKVLAPGKARKAKSLDAERFPQTKHDSGGYGGARNRAKTKLYQTQARRKAR